MRIFFDRHNLNTYMVLSYVVVVLLTAIAVGLPAIFLIRGQLERQAWSQVLQGLRAAEALYAAQQRELANLATLTAQRPTLRSLIDVGEAAALADYLDTLRSGADLDLILVCTADHAFIGTSGEVVPTNACLEDTPPEFLLIPGLVRPHALMTASHQISGADKYWVVVATRMDDSLAESMQAATGLEHIIWLSRIPVASSFASAGIDGISLTSLDIDQIQGGEAGKLQVHRQPYYAAFLPLDSLDLEASVALPVSDIASAQKRLILLMAGGILVATALGTILGLQFSRPISRPLGGLAAAAEDLSRGKLESPVGVESSIHEITQVSQALDRARTDLLATLTELRQEKAWTSHLLASIVEGIMTLDAGHRITYFSHGAERIMGWEKEQVLRRSCDEIFLTHKDDALFSQQIPLPGQKNNITVLLPTGNARTLSVTRAELMPLEAGDAQMALVFRDVSEEEAIHRLLGNFIANIAHEFRTPLSALDASIELLLDQREAYSPGEVRELLETVRLGILGLERLIDNLLESASIEAGHFRVSPRVVDLREIISEAVNTMRPLLEKYEQKLVVELPESLPLVKADPRRIEQVLVNLLSNANKYGPVDAEIILRVILQGSWARVSVTDQGSGIPVEKRAHLFRRFGYELEGETGRKVGAGLGLSVVKATIEAHGGSVSLEDHPGGGSEFWFTIPLADL